MITFHLSECIKLYEYLSLFGKDVKKGQEKMQHVDQWCTRYSINKW